MPEDPDITSLWISLRDISHKKPKDNTTPSSGTANTTRPRFPKNTLRSSYSLHQSAVQQVFQALIELLNGDTRTWKFIYCHVLYSQVPKYGVPQTEALMEVADGYDVPLQVQWQPMDRANLTGNWVRNSSRAEYLLPGSSSKSGTSSKYASTTKELEDTTASTVCYEGSSGALSFVH